jgi:hypothetical protein
MFQKYSSALKGRRRPPILASRSQGRNRKGGQAQFRRFFMGVRRFAYSVAVALALSALWPSSPRSRAIHAQTHTAPHDGTQAGALVKVVREATERFRDVRVAEAEGYALTFGCVSGGDYGAMGLHYVNFPLVLDGALDPTRPEIPAARHAR